MSIMRGEARNSGVVIAKASVVLSCIAGASGVTSFLLRDPPILLTMVWLILTVAALVSSACSFRKEVPLVLKITVGITLAVPVVIAAIFVYSMSGIW